MIVKFDKLNRLESPKLILCNPGSVYNQGRLSKVVGVLSHTEAEEIVFNFNATSELNFRINKVQGADISETTHLYNLYKAVQNRRLIFVEEIGFFAITGVTDGFDGHTHYKDVTAKSIDIELEQKTVPYIEDGTYALYSQQAGFTGVLNLILDLLPLWTVEHIDNSLLSKYRTFEDVDITLNCLSFLIEKVQEAYECIVLFDIASRTISVYDENSYVQQTDIHLTKDDLINSLEITENSEDIYTALTVRGGDDDITISAVNPLQISTIYNFDYYLDWMSPELKAKVVAWKEAINDATEDRDNEQGFYSLSRDRYGYLAEAAECEANINKLNIQVSMYDKCRENITALGNTSSVNSYNSVIRSAGGSDEDLILISSEIEATKTDISQKKALCLEERDGRGNKDDYDNIDSSNWAGWTNKQARALSNESMCRLLISDKVGGLPLNVYFTAEELLELDNYIFEGEYSDEYVIFTDIMTLDEKFEQMSTLYDRAKRQLNKLSTPTQEFNIDATNFVFIKEFEAWSNQLETGCLINAELTDNDIAQLFLSTITINYDDHNLSLTFGNRFNKFDPKSLFENVLGSVNRSANSVSYLKDLTHPIKDKALDKMQEAIQNSRNVTMGSALSSENEEVVIDGSGYTGKTRTSITETGEPVYDPQQVKIVGKNIVFTDDGWDTCRTAIGEIQTPNGDTTYGINAETVVGELIIGEQLQINCIDETGETQSLFEVVDGKISSQVSDLSDNIDNRLSEYTTVEQTKDLIRLNVKSVTTEMGYTFDDDGLKIKKSDSEIGNKIDNEGLEVKKEYLEDGVIKEEVILKADTNGVNANNLTARNYLIVGKNCRFEDYEDRTGCFYIGDVT